jgi:hypothetical protein
VRKRAAARAWRLASVPELVKRILERWKRAQISLAWEASWEIVEPRQTPMFVMVFMREDWIRGWEWP